MPIPITFVITDLDVGGAERALVSLATGLNRRRWAPTVVCLGGEGKLAESLRGGSIPTVCLNAQRDRPLRALRRLRHALRKSRPAIVQSFLFHANLATKLVAAVSGVAWCLGGLRVAERRDNAHLRLDRWTQRLSAGSVCVSEGVRRFSIEVGGLSPERLTVIPNGIDARLYDSVPVFNRGLLGITAVAPVTLFVGRIDEQKGVDLLLQAAMHVLKVRSDGVLVLVGDGPARQTLEQPAERVLWLGRRDDVASLLKMADLVIVPSRWEGMPNVVLEAMAARKPVLGTSIEGTEELVVPDETGWLVPAGNLDALAGAWLDALSNRQRLRDFGEAAKVRVDRSFRQEDVIAQYDTLWSRLLGYVD